MPDPAAQTAPPGQPGPKGPADPVAILARLAALPTAPFHELRVAREIVAICEAAGLPWEADPFGNLVVWHRGGSAGAVPSPSGRTWITRRWRWCRPRR